jgi:hypothetical protein
MQYAPTRISDPRYMYADLESALHVCGSRLREGATLITKDENILRYGKTGHVSVSAA